MPRVRSLNASALFLPDDPERAARVEAAWAWKEKWREAQRRLPFDQKLTILCVMMNDERLHGRTLAKRPKA